ncbi:AAA family ATPase [Bosea sp. 117]|uniref:AAA family ATPase n=1 Tax=Bosea sp. 117 TaxID=1125973 RepID=UPI000494B6BD|nr:AAA family ATPase [Bosea sp. 117]
MAERATARASEVNSEIHVPPLPRVSIQAFCDSSGLAGAMQAAAADRRLARANMKLQMGGLAAAEEAYRNASTPNVIIVESPPTREALFAGLEALAEHCDAGTKVVVIGRLNDIMLYRELIRRGVSDYLIEPVEPLDVVASLSGLFSAPDAAPLGRTLAVYAAKGGVGASTVAHNVAFAIARHFDLETVIADFDLPFGTAGLDFNQDPPQGAADALLSPERVDVAFVDRLLSKCADRLSLLAAPATLERSYDLTPEAFEPLMDVLRASTPMIVIDVPHLWTSWARQSVMAADDVLIVAAPDLANLRNAKNLFDTLRAARPNDRLPRYVLNQVGMPKRPEIRSADFAKALGSEPLAVIPFDAALFGTASNNGQMIAEVSASHKAVEAFRAIGQATTGRSEARRASNSMIAPLIARLRGK